MNRAIGILALVLVSTFAGIASGAIYTGNPVLSLRVDRPQHDLVSGDVGLSTVRMEYCGGGYTDYAVGTTIDPVDGYSLPVSSGDYCGVTLLWSGTMTLYGSNFTLAHSASATYLPLDTSPSTVLLSSTTVVSGSPSSGTPRLSVNIQ